ncbi:MAG TPA: FtsX-like permease family protein, partial [Vicinamibacterales bacterium]|nr:FtsX-like permease family protein [Vicinamibacterales bacterium]
PTTPFFSGKAEIVTLLDAAALGNSNAFFHPVVRLESGVTVEQADAETDTILASVRAEDPKLKDATLVLGDVRETMYPVGRPIMRFLLIAAMLVLLVGCANLANMLLARARRQERETAVRAALGASRIRVIRPLVFEALLIGMAGSAVALIVTALMFDLLRQAVPNAALGGSAVGVDGRIVWMGIALGLAGGVIFAGVPAWRAMRVDVIALLHGRHRSHRGRSVLGRPMLALQVALAIVLVFGAGVATRAFVDVLRTPIGFNHDGVVQLGVGPPSPDGRTEFYRRLIDLLQARTDVIAVGAAGSPPLSGTTGWSGVRRPGSNDMLAAIFHVTPGFFEALGIAPTSGRLLTWDDAMRAPHAVLSASAARTLFPGLNPLAQVVDDGTQRWQVAGIIPDIPSDVQRGVPPVYVIPTGRTTSMTIFARMRGDARMLPDELRRDIRRVVPEAPVDAGWWSDAIGSLTQYKNPRFQTMVLGSFASIALALTALGIFGVVAFIVTARTREMGIRVAIGAQPGSLVGLIVRQALLPVGLGLLLGLIATQWAAKLAESQLFKVQTRDPWMLAMTAAAVVAAAMLAAWLPARRAARVDPIVVLRTE